MFLATHSAQHTVSTYYCLFLRQHTMLCIQMISIILIIAPYKCAVYVHMGARRGGGMGKSKHSSLSGKLKQICREGLLSNYGEFFSIWGHFSPYGSPFSMFLLLGGVDHICPYGGLLELAPTTPPLLQKFLRALMYVLHYAGAQHIAGNFFN